MGNSAQGTCGLGGSVHDSDAQCPADCPDTGKNNDAWEEEALVGCSALENGIHQVIANANRGGARISDEVLLNHDLLQQARQGSLKGVSAALEKGAWTETRRPLVMRPQKPDGKSKDRHASGVFGMTALMFASQAGSADCVRRLIWASANVNAVEEDGWTALHFGAKEGSLDVCTTLLQSRADPSLSTLDEETPLQIASASDPDFAKKLESVLKKHAS